VAEWAIIPMQPKNPLFQKCFDYLESLPDLKVVLQSEPYFSSQFLADGKLIIQTSNKSVAYVCEIKVGLTNDVIEQVVEYFSTLGTRLKPNERPLLVTRGLSNLVINNLLQEKIEFIDVDGNIYLNSPEIYMLVRNQVSQESSNKSLEITPTALQVIYTLLSQPDLLNYDEDFEEKIAYSSGASSKAVKIILQKLQDLDYIARRSKGYEISDYVRLFERWELGYTERLRPKLLLGTFTPIEKGGFAEVRDIIKVAAGRFNYFIGGELAASVMTDYLRPVSATLHLGNDLNHHLIAVRLRLKPDPDGDIALLQTFGHSQYPPHKSGVIDQQHLAHPLLVHAELVRTGNSRLKETAQLIYDRYIEELAQKHDKSSRKTSFG
jgi:hypothetical protein